MWILRFCIVLLCVCSISAADEGFWVPGKYECAPEQNEADWINYMKAVEIETVKMPLVQKLNTFEIVQLNDNTFIMRVFTPYGTRATQFENGVEKDDIYIDGRSCKAIYTIEGNNMTKVYKFGNFSSECTAEFSSTGMKSLCGVKDITAAKDCERIS